MKHSLMILLAALLMSGETARAENSLGSYLGSTEKGRRCLIEITEDNLDSLEWVSDKLTSSARKIRVSILIPRKIDSTIEALGQDQTSDQPAGYNPSHLSYSDTSEENQTQEAVIILTPTSLKWMRIQADNGKTYTCQGFRKVP